MILDGKKTYIVGVSTLAYAVGGLVAGKLDFNLAIASILAALQMMSIRHGIDTSRVQEKIAEIENPEDLEE